MFCGSVNTIKDLSRLNSGNLPSFGSALHLRRSWTDFYYGRPLWVYSFVKTLIPLPPFFMRHIRS